MSLIPSSVTSDNNLSGGGAVANNGSSGGALGRSQLSKLERETNVEIKADFNKEGWEKTNFPLLCETCLGDNPFVRMTKEDYGCQCQICTRPMTMFKWKPGGSQRYKQNVICATCARLKNVCQTCIFDLQYGLPVQVRDK